MLLSTRKSCAMRQQWHDWVIELGTFSHISEFFLLRIFVERDSSVDVLVNFTITTLMIALFAHILNVVIFWGG